MADELCKHELDNIRIVWDIRKMGSGYRVETPRAVCLACNTHLPDIEPQARLAIDLVMVEVARREKLSREGVFNSEKAG